MSYTPASSSFPTSLDTPVNPTSTSDTSDFDHAGLETFQNDAIEQLQTAVGITSSADTASLNYKLTNTSSSNPGHKHTLANGATDVTATAAELNVLDGATATTAQLSALNDLTPSQAVITNGDGVLASSSVTSLELASLLSIDSNVQTQLDSKVDQTNGTLITPKVTTAYSNGDITGTPTINWSNGDLQTATLTGNVTLAFSNAAAGQRLTLFLAQDGTGGRTIAFTPTIVWQDASTPTWTTTASKLNVMVIYYDGSAYYGMGAKFA